MTATRKPLGRESLMNVLLAPHVTEKSSLGLQERNQYAFRVRREQHVHERFPAKGLARRGHCRRSSSSFTAPTVASTFSWRARLTGLIIAAESSST